MQWYVLQCLNLYETIVLKKPIINNSGEISHCKYVVRNVLCGDKKKTFIRVIYFEISKN